ncbi:FAD-dependent oxidoreductase [candidate division KSB1 bacterium]|nr:FAD-dependent oxidoreductase [candidate division KSB1 bacterium]
MSDVLRIISQTEIARGTLEVTLQKPDQFTYLAGQNINLRLPELRYEDEKGPRRTFTLTSAPHEPHLLIATRLSGSGYKKTLAELEAGSVCEFVGPQGKFVYDDKVEKSVWLAGGIGITPFRSMLLHADKQETFPDITLLYGNADIASTAYHDLLVQVAERQKSFHYVPSLTELAENDSWQGERRLISLDVIQEYLPDWEEVTYFLCGPPGMIKALTEQLQSAGLSEEKIRSESLWGY